jgi:hypothetical protein
MSEGDSTMHTEYIDLRERRRVRDRRGEHVQERWRQHSQEPYDDVPGGQGPLSADRLREGRHRPDEEHEDWEGDPRPLDQLEMQLRCAPIGAQKPVRKVARSSVVSCLVTLPRAMLNSSRGLVHAVHASQMRMVPSAAPVTMRLPSKLKAMPVTGRGSCHTRRSRPVDGSQTLTVSSRPGGREQRATWAVGDAVDAERVSVEHDPLLHLPRMLDLVLTIRRGHRRRSDHEQERVRTLDRALDRLREHLRVGDPLGVQPHLLAPRRDRLGQPAHKLGVAARIRHEHVSHQDSAGWGGGSAARPLAAALGVASGLAPNRRRG